MPAAVAFCPCPPLLVPQLAAGAAPELDALRDACDAAVAALLAAGPERITVLAAGPGGRWGREAGGSFAPHGVDVRAGGEQAGLTGALLVGAWLLDRSAWTGARHYAEVADRAPAADGRDAWLVLGDGSAKRTDRSPGEQDDRAVGYDDEVVAALRTGDADALTTLDLELGAALWSSGAAVWRAVGQAVAGRVERARLHADTAPYGVGYAVADWIVRAR